MGSAGTRLGAVDDYIARSAGFAQPVLQYLRDVIHEGAPGVVEEMKWSRPFFVYQGVILGNISAFKAHCSLGLWGPEIAEAIRETGEAKGEGMGTFGKIASIEDLPEHKKLVRYVCLAAKAIGDGVRTTAWSRPWAKVAKPIVVVPEVLAVALKRNTVAAKNFAAMTSSSRREYCTWIADAKRQETKEKRVLEAVAMIAEGKSRNWKYKRAGSKK